MFQVKANSIVVCIIDDCGDVDVPLLEFSLDHLHLKQNLGASGSLECRISNDYYNRVLSGWEPVIEPWRYELHLCSKKNGNILQILGQAYNGGARYLQPYQTTASTSKLSPPNS